MDLASLTETLHREHCSCVIAGDGRTVLCHRRGVIDLLDALRSDPQLLRGAFVADKVVGKGAAALMILGGVSVLHADVISLPALRLLEDSGVEVSHDTCVPNIINRSGTGVCPVETLCRDCLTAAECLPLIEDFVNKMTQK